MLLPKKKRMEILFIMKKSLILKLSMDHITNPIIMALLTGILLIGLAEEI
jgi:hypothetical protein